MANESLRQQLALLYELQEHDRELLSFHQRLQVIPQHIEQLEANVTKYKDSLTTKSDQLTEVEKLQRAKNGDCLLYTSPSPRDRTRSRMPSSA